LDNIESWPSAKETMGIVIFQVDLHHEHFMEKWILEMDEIPILLKI